MRKAISNDEQTWYIQNRWDFYTRQGVYRGFTDSAGDYVLIHWSTTIAIFRKDGTVYLETDHGSATTNQYRWRIWRAMTPEERESAAHGVIVRMRSDALRYPWWSHNNPRFRAELARWESIYYTPDRMAGRAA